MVLRRILIFLTFALFCIACTQQSENKKTALYVNEKLGIGQVFSIDFIGEISPELYLSLLEYPENLIIVSFDAECSACVVKFIEFIKKVHIQDFVTYLYVGTSKQDLLLLEYYLDKTGRVFSSNEHLLCDNSNAYKRYNPNAVMPTMPIVIINKNLKVKAAMSLYSINSGIINSLNDLHFESVILEGKFNSDE